MVNKKHKITWKITLWIIISFVFFLLYFQSFYFPLPVTRTLCEVGDGTRRIYLEQRMGIGYSYSIHGKTHIGTVWGGDKLKFDNGELFGKKTLFPSDVVKSSGFSKATCTGSRIIGDTIYVNAVRTSHMGTPNGMYISQDGGDKFEFRALPHMESPPILVRKDGYLYEYARLWSGWDVNIKDNGLMELEQELILRDRDNSFIDSKPVIWRRMESHDTGVTWKLKEYKIIRPEYIPSSINLILVKKKLVVDFTRKPHENIKVIDEDNQDQRNEGSLGSINRNL